MKGRERNRNEMTRKELRKKRKVTKREEEEWEEERKEGIGEIGRSSEEPPLRKMRKSKGGKAVE